MPPTGIPPLRARRLDLALQTFAGQVSAQAAVSYQGRVTRARASIPVLLELDGFNTPVVADDQHSREFPRSAMVSPTVGPQDDDRLRVQVGLAGRQRLVPIRLTAVLQNVPGIVTRFDQGGPATQGIAQYRWTFHQARANQRKRDQGLHKHRPSSAQTDMEW